ncbi:MAG: hypothetical protein HOW97_26085 [Catenulispora sp.]|nr:hypothetical protein [Catenulispora sp.]
MKLRLRVGRRAQARDTETDEPGPSTVPAARVHEPQRLTPAEPPHVPLPRTPDRHHVRAGSFCRLGEVGQTAVTESGRAVLAVRAGHCGRWVYAEHA